MHRHLVFILFVALLTGPLAAAENHLVFDPSVTTVTFFLEATGHDVHGTFVLAGGDIRFDPATGVVSGTITIDATRAETGNGKRDKKMHRKVLETETYPEISFMPTRIDGSVAASGESTVSLVGMVAIHGVEHEVSVPTTVELADQSFTAHATMTIPYVEWGMKDPSVLMLRVAKEVEIEIAAQGTRTIAEADADVAE